jgi:hypothetical protein
LKYAVAPGPSVTCVAGKFVNEGLPARTTVVGSCVPDAPSSTAPGKPFMVHVADDVLCMPKLTSNVPAAPWLPMTLMASWLAVHAVDDPPDPLEVVVDDAVLELEGAVVVVDAPVWDDEHAARPSPSDAARSAPERRIALRS